MPKLVLGVAFTLLFSLGAWGVIEPRYATDLENFSAADKADEDTIRLRITIASDTQRAVRIGDLLLCSRAACYRARTTGFVAVERGLGGRDGRPGTGR